MLGNITHTLSSLRMPRLSRALPTRLTRASSWCVGYLLVVGDERDFPGIHLGFVFKDLAVVLPGLIHGIPYFGNFSLDVIGHGSSPISLWPARWRRAISLSPLLPAL